MGEAVVRWAAVDQWCRGRRRNRLRNQKKELCGVERQIYMPGPLFCCKQAARSRIVVVKDGRPLQAARRGRVDIIDQILRRIQAGATADRPAQRIINGSGTGQFLLSGRPLNVLTAVAIA
jgi:hypothetical protein